MCINSLHNSSIIDVGQWNKVITPTLLTLEKRDATQDATSLLLTFFLIFCEVEEEEEEEEESPSPRFTPAHACTSSNIQTPRLNLFHGLSVFSACTLTKRLCFILKCGARMFGMRVFLFFFQIFFPPVAFLSTG